MIFFLLRTSSKKGAKEARSIQQEWVSTMPFSPLALLFLHQWKMASLPELDPNLFATTKKSWDELKEMIETEKFDNLRRSIKQQKFYQNYRNKVKRSWRSMYDFILHHKFNYDVITVYPEKSVLEDVPFAEYEECEGDISLLPSVQIPPPGSQWASRPASDKKRIKEKVMALNDFPYYLNDEIEHWVLWKIGSNITQEDIDCKMKELHDGGKYSDVLYWMNPVHLKSLPDIDHVHIVCQRKE